MAWADVAWAPCCGTVAWSDVAWSDAAWADAAWADNANDPAIGDVTDTSSLQEDQALAALGIVNDCDLTRVPDRSELVPSVTRRRIDPE